MPFIIVHGAVENVMRENEFLTKLCFVLKKGMFSVFLVV